jgi:hypothetical protein
MRNTNIIADVRDGKIFITDKADNRKIITCEDELNAILITSCVNQDGTFNINLSLPPPQSHGMFLTFDTFFNTQGCNPVDLLWKHYLNMVI